MPFQLGLDSGAGYGVAVDNYPGAPRRTRRTIYLLRHVLTAHVAKDDRHFPTLMRRKTAAGTRRIYCSL
jgi:hypothetical protein